MNQFPEKESCYVIAEIGVNHGGDLALAKKMVSAARVAGADAVKFQTFTAKSLVSPGTPKVAYQEKTTPVAESHFEMIRSLELARDDHQPLIDFCATEGLDFISTPYDVESVRFLNELGVSIFKVASADVVDLPLHEFIANTGRPAILATGMATLGEVEDMLEVYRNFRQENLVLLHCVSNYPCSAESMNLRVMKTLNRAFQLPVGLSDHSEGSTAAILAVALGARVIEKHLTLDRSLPGPDHKASSTPEEFSDFVKAVRRAESMLGSPIKQCQAEERQMARTSRKSLKLSREKKQGETLNAEDLVLMRPGTGLASLHKATLIGRRMAKDCPIHHQVDWGDVT